MNLPESGYKRHVAIFFYTVVFSLLVLLAGALVFKVLFVFLVAWCFAMALRPLVRKAHKLTGVSEKTCGIILCVLVLFLIFSLCALLMIKLSAQIKELPKIISDAYAMLTQKLDELYENLPIKDEVMISSDKFGAYIDTLAQNLVNSLSKTAASIAKNVPQKAFAFVIFIISCIYFCADLEGINAFLYKLLPSTLKKMAKSVKTRFCGVLVKYVKAHLIIMLLTFLKTVYYPQ